MTVPRSREVRGHALARRAPRRLLRTPVWGITLLLVSGLLVASLLAPGWFVRAAEDAALSLDRSALDGEAFGSGSANLRVTWLGRVPRGIEPRLEQELADLPHYDDPVTTASATGPTAFERPLVGANGRSAVGVLWFRDGVVEAVGGPAGTRPGVWLPRRLAAGLAVTVGDEVTLSLTPYSVTGPGRRKVAIPVAGVFDPVEGSALPGSVAAVGVDPLEHPWYPDRPGGAGTALLLTDEQSFRAWTRLLQDRPRYTEDLRLAPDLTPTQMRTAVAAVEALERRLYDPSQALRQGLDEAEPPLSPQVVTAAPVILEGAAVTAAQARTQVAPFVRATQVLTLALLAVALALLSSRRGVENAALSGLGVSPSQRVLVAVLEMLPIALLGVPLGAALAWMDVVGFGPPGRASPRETWSGAALLGVLGAVLVLGVAAVTAAVTAWRHDRALREVVSAGTSPRSGFGGWPAAVVALAVATAVSVWTTDLGTRSAGPLTLLFPLATAAGIAVVVTLVWASVGARLPRGWARPGSPRWLARHRTSVRSLVPATLALTVGLTVLGYGMAVRRGVADSVADKAASLAGARTAADLGQQLQGRRFSELADLAGPGSTVVHRRSATLPPSFGDKPLLVVDPVGFDDVADWGATLDPARRALADLGQAKTGTSVPVVLVGRTELRPGDETSLGVPPEPLVPASVIAVVDAFPGTSAGTPELTVVTSRKGLFSLVSRGIDPRTRPDRTFGGEFTAWVWSERPAREVDRALAGQDLVGDHVQRLEVAQSRPELLASAWAVGYLAPLEVGAGLMVVAALVLLARRLLERDAVTDLLLRRMGWSGQELLSSRLREIVAAVLVSAVAAAAAVGLLLLAPTTIESVPRLPPVTEPHLAAGDVALWCAGIVGALAVAALVLARGHRRPPEEVLRGNL